LEYIRQISYSAFLYIFSDDCKTGRHKIDFLYCILYNDYVFFDDCKIERYWKI